jgi:RNA 3'-terminal phosphate cyclase (ATP)
MCPQTRITTRAKRAPLVLDGSHGEGGGQILRTAVAIAVATGRPLHMVNIRAGRPKPGLAAQHLTAIRAAAALCNARLKGDALASQDLEFTPRRPVGAGAYRFDVAEARMGGSAGSATLVLQTVLVPLALAPSPSEVTIKGGTHVAWSPSFDYVQNVWLPALATMGISADVDLASWGWLPVGRGEIRASIPGGLAAPRPLILTDRGHLRRIFGRAVAANLPAHIPSRMAAHARALLREAGLEAVIDEEVTTSACAGAGLFLVAEYERARAGFDAMGARGKPAERVAQEAATALLSHYRSGAALDSHLADQIVLPAALASGGSQFSVERLSRHLATNAWTVEKFGLASVDIAAARDETGVVTINPITG